MRFGSVTAVAPLPVRRSVRPSRL